MLQTARSVILCVKSAELPFVIDADGLCVVERDPELIRGYDKVILTPNAVEFERLCSSVKIQDTKTPDAVNALAKALGNVVIVRKGETDVISNGHGVTWTCDHPGSVRRVGGQGDILSGAIGTFMAWSNMKHTATKEPVENGSLLAAYAGCMLTRECSRRAFEQHGRSMLTSDMLEHIGPSFRALFEQ
jgi:ATP-dependent NAD(P)H-hydrate dehydratase